MNQKLCDYPSRVYVGRVCVCEKDKVVANWTPCIPVLQQCLYCHLAMTRVISNDSGVDPCDH